MKKIAIGMILFGLTFLGCNRAVNVEVIDLNKVLDTFQATLDRLDEEQKLIAEEAGQEAVDKIVEVKQEDPKQNEKLLTEFAKDLNAARLMSKPIGTKFSASGAIEGFTDANKNSKQDAGEKRLFTIELDLERNRLIASDESNHHRDHRYRPRFGGFFTGYMLGSMLNRSNSYYSGSRAGLRKDWGKQSMSSKNYHASAVSKARSSARARSGSRGFSFGK